MAGGIGEPIPQNQQSHVGVLGVCAVGFGVRRLLQNKLSHVGGALRVGGLGEPMLQRVAVALSETVMQPLQPLWWLWSLRISSHSSANDAKMARAR